MALPALLGAGARVIGGSMVKSGGRAVASKILGRKKGTQPGRIIPGAGGKGGEGRGGAIVPRTKMVSPKEMKSLKAGDPVSPGKDPLKSIYGNVILIEKILKGTYASEKDQLRKQRQDDKKSDKKAQEKKLETKSPKIDRKKGEIKKLPKTGIFDWITNFIGNILMGYFAVRLIKYLPQLMGMLKGLGKVIEFVTDVGMFLVDGLASFINFSYNVYDGTRNIMKGIGLDGAFDAVMKAMEVAITVLAFALGAQSLGGFGGGGRGGRGGGGRTGISGRSAGRTRTTSSQAARRYAQRFGRNAATRRFGEQGVRSLGGKYARSSATNLARRATVGVLGKGGTKAALKIVAPLVKRVPIIGGILEFALSLLAGEPVGKAAFRAIGSGLGTWIGGALGSLIPIPFVGTAIGAFVGGAGGSELAGVMYDAFFGGKEKQPEPEEPEAKQRGGQVNRGFQQTTLEQQEKAITKKPSFEKIKAPEGGKIKTGKKTDQAWWDFLGWAGTGGQDEMMDLGPGGQLLANRVVKLGNSFGEHPFFGPILSLAAKIILGQTPNEKQYKNVGYGLNMMVRAGIAGGKIGEGIKGYADGGMVRTMGGVNIGRWATDSFKKELSNTLYKNFDVMNPGSTDGPGTPAGVRDPATGELVGTGATPGPGGIIPQGQMTGTPSQQEAFNKIYNIAKQVGGAKFPELVAAHSMQETGYLANPNSIFFNSGKTNAFGQTIFANEVGTNGIVDKIWHAGRWWAIYDSIESSVKHHIKLWHSTHRHKTNYNSFDKYAEGMAVIIPNYSSDADPENIRRGFSEDAYAKGMFNHLKLGGFDPKGPTGTRKIVQNTPNVQPSQSGQQPQQQQSVQQGKGSEAAQKLLKDFPQIKSRGSSQEIYASGLGYWLKRNFVPPAKDPHRIGRGDLGDPRGGDMEHPDHGGVVAYHRGTGHKRGVALDLGAHAVIKGGPHKDDQKYMWPYISRFLTQYGLSIDPYIPRVLYGRGESFSPTGPGSGPDGYGGHDDHFHVEFHKGGLVGGTGEVPALLKSGEIVIDNDSSISKVLPMLLAINKAKDEKGVLNAIRNYAPYEAGAQQTIMIQDPPQQMPEESLQSSGGGMMLTGGSSHDPFEFLDYQG